MVGFEDIKIKLQQVLSQHRLQHTLRVANLAAQLAVKFEFDPQKAYLAGLLHDYARDISDGQLLDLARKEGLIKHPLEEQSPMLLHGPVGAFLVKLRFGITDQEVLNAICYHTTGRAGMGILEQLLFMADGIEPGRQYAGVNELRQDIGEISEPAKGAELLLAHALIYNIKKGVLIHPASVEGLNWLRAKV